MKKQKYSEWKENEKTKVKEGLFDLFEISCKKCNSKFVEFNSDVQEEICPYYGNASLEGEIIVKCHECGNAFKIEAYSLDNYKEGFEKIGDFE